MYDRDLRVNYNCRFAMVNEAARVYTCCTTPCCLGVVARSSGVAVLCLRWMRDSAEVAESRWQQEKTLLFNDSAMVPTPCHDNILLPSSSRLYGD